MIPTIRSLLGTLPQAFYSQYVAVHTARLLVPVLGGPRASLTLHCEFKLGKDLCA